MRMCASQLLSGIISPLHVFKSQFTFICPFSIPSLDKHLLLADWAHMKNEKYSRWLQAVPTALATVTVPSNFLFCGMTCILHDLMTCILQLPPCMPRQHFQKLFAHNLDIKVKGCERFNLKSKSQSIIGNHPRIQNMQPIQM